MCSHFEHSVNELIKNMSVLNTWQSNHLKLVKDAVVFIEAAELGAEVLVDGESLNRFRLHMQVPNFH